MVVHLRHRMPKKIDKKPQKKSDEKQPDKIFRKKSDALNKGRSDARIQGGPVRVDYICAPGGGRCTFILCRLFNRHRLPYSVTGPGKIIKSRAEAKQRMNNHIKQEKHNPENHCVFVNVFYRVANTYTYNGKETQYVLIQFHPGGHPLLGENRHHFHIRPAWIENNQLQYNDSATPDLDNFTPADHYYYETDDMNDYWFDEELSGSCKEKDPPHDEDDKHHGSGSNTSRKRSSSRDTSRDRSSSKKTKSDSRNQDDSKQQGSNRSGRSNTGGGTIGSCQCKRINPTVAKLGTAAKLISKKEGFKQLSKQATKQLSKQASVSTAKGFATKVPFVGAAIGLGFGLVRACRGDGKGALGEIASGALSLVPGVGTVASVSVDVGLAARDHMRAAASPSSGGFCNRCGKMKF